MRAAEVDAIVARADELARASGWPGPGLEHVTLAVLEGARGRSILERAGADLDTLRAAVQRTLQATPAPREAPLVDDWVDRLGTFVEEERKRPLEAADLLAMVVDSRESSLVACLTGQGVRKLDVLSVIAHGIRWRDRAAPVPRARLLRASREPSAPKGYRVYVHTDDFTPIGFVLHLLVWTFGKLPGDADDIAQRAHATGRAIVGTYPLALVSGFVDQAAQAAEEYEYPLLVTFEPEDAPPT